MQTLNKTQRVLEMIATERQRQRDKWGEQSVPNGIWMKILMEEVGESAKEALEDWVNQQSGAVYQAHADGIDHHERLIKELTEVAAVAVSWIEDLQANGRKVNEVNHE